MTGNPGQLLGVSKTVTVVPVSMVYNPVLFVELAAVHLEILGCSLMVSQVATSLIQLDTKIICVK